MEEENLTVQESSIDTLLQIHNQIQEFDVWTLQNFQSRLSGPEAIVLVAFKSGQPLGYLCGYDRWHDGSFYVWMTGVVPAGRRLGCLRAMMAEMARLAKGKGYGILKIKTRNGRREMLGYLVKEGWNFMDVVPMEKEEDNRILLQKVL